MKRTTRNAAKTRRAIIEKSAPIFNVHGYAGTTMQMLVDASGYQMGGIYRHFDKKIDLAKAVFTYNYQTLIKRSLAFEPDQNPKEKLLAILSNYEKMVINPVIDGGCPILNTATEVDDTDEDFRQLANSFVEEILDTIEGILLEGKTMGLFKPTINPKKEALYLFATFEGAVMVGKITRKAQSFYDIFSQTRTYLENAIFA